MIEAQGEDLKDVNEMPKYKKKPSVWSQIFKKRK